MQVKDLDEIQLLDKVGGELGKLLVLKRQGMDGEESIIHTEFIAKYLRTSCSGWDIFDIGIVFHKYATGDLGDNRFLNSISIIDAFKMFRTTKQVKGTVFNNQQAELSRSQENRDKVQRSLENGVIYDRQCVYYTFDEYIKVDPSFRMNWEYTMQLANNLIKSKI